MMGERHKKTRPYLFGGFGNQMPVSVVSPLMLPKCPLNLWQSGWHSRPEKTSRALAPLALRRILSNALP